MPPLTHYHQWLEVYLLGSVVNSVQPAISQNYHIEYLRTLICLRRPLVISMVGAGISRIRKSYMFQSLSDNCCLPFTQRFYGLRGKGWFRLYIRSNYFTSSTYIPQIGRWKEVERGHVATHVATWPAADATVNCTTFLPIVSGPL